MSEWRCVYCGGPGNTEDHVPPRASYLIGIGDFVRVRACLDCNAALGARPLFTIADRKAWIRENHPRRAVAPLGRSRGVGAPLAAPKDPETTDGLHGEAAGYFY